MLDFIGYRWADYDTPLWASANRSAGRWNRAGSAPTQYWSLHPLGPWAEYLRAQAIRDEVGLRAITSRTWVARFEFDDIAVGAISFDTAGTWHISAADLVADDHAPCQALGDVLRGSFEAVVVPSAALPGTDNLVIFGARVMAPYGTLPVDPDLDVPTAPTGDHAHPPLTVLSLVCHRGDPHSGLSAWSSGAGPIGPPSTMFPIA